MWVQAFVKGSTNYASIRLQHFPQLAIPLPVIDGRAGELNGCYRMVFDEGRQRVLVFFKRRLCVPN